MAQLLRSLTSVLLIVRSSHRFGFATHSGHGSHVVQLQVLLASVSGVFPRVLPFSPHLPIDSSQYECNSLKGM